MVEISLGTTEVLTSALADSDLPPFGIPRPTAPSLIVAGGGGSGLSLVASQWNRPHQQRGLTVIAVWFYCVAVLCCASGGGLATVPER